MLRLVTLAYSHYNEKARWALELAGLPYREERHMPLFSSVAVAIATRGRGGRSEPDSTRYSTPVLFCKDGTQLHDSSDIARFAAARGAPWLYGEPEIDEIEARTSTRLGPHTRRVGYFHAAEDPSILQEIAEHNVSPRQAAWFGRLGPVVRKFVSLGLGMNRESRDRSEEIVREELRWVEERLGERRYLVGDRFTAADLTFACMLAPALLVQQHEGYSGWLPPASRGSAELAALVGELRRTRGGEFALRMFRDHRRPIRPQRPA